MALLAAGPAGASSGDIRARGKAIFSAKCAACHSVGHGRLVGPDLKGVLERRPRAWLERFIRAPGEVIAAGDPTATSLLQQFGNLRMPAMGLSEGDVSAVLAYLGGAASGGAKAATAAAVVPGGAGSTRDAPASALAPAAAGRAAAGRALFVGSVRLEEGGPACISCHSVEGVGILGGGTLGPDLTGAEARFGRKGLAGVLAALPFPTMRPVYAGRPLTGTEQGDLLAFFAEAVRGGGARRASRAGFLWLGLGGFAVLVGLPTVVWRGRFRGVRRRLVGGS